MLRVCMGVPRIINSKPLLESSPVLKVMALAPEELANEALNIAIIGTNSAGTGAGGVTSGTYNGSNPNFTPSSLAQFAVDVLTGKLWLFYSAQWRDTGIIVI